MERLSQTLIMLCKVSENGRRFRGFLNENCEDRVRAADYLGLADGFRVSTLTKQGQRINVSVHGGLSGTVLLSRCVALARIYHSVISENQSSTGDAMNFRNASPRRVGNMVTYLNLRVPFCPGGAGWLSILTLTSIKPLSANSLRTKL